MDHRKNIVKKPWGYEYLAYENESVALWFLNISKDQKTSMHCHPQKTTGLMVIEGNAEVSFLSNKANLTKSEKIMIRKGLFHSTKADNADLRIFEIETPVNKLDLVRLDDSYGRAGQPYENENFELPKLDECIWIEEPNVGKFNAYKFGEVEIIVHAVSDFSELQQLNESSKCNLMFLRGGLLTDYGIKVAGPGDIVAPDVLQRLMSIFKNVENQTIVLRHGNK